MMRIIIIICLHLTPSSIENLMAPKNYVAAILQPISYNSMAAKPPATAAKLIPLIAPAAVEAVAGLELVAELLDPVLLADAAGVAVPEAVLVGIKLLTATDGMVTF